MSKARYVTGLRAVEQLLAGDSPDVQRIYAEYQTVNPRVEALIVTANSRGIDVQAANRARLQQISGEARILVGSANGPCLMFAKSPACVLRAL